MRGDPCPHQSRFQSVLFHAEFVFLRPSCLQPWGKAQFLTTFFSADLPPLVGGNRCGTSAFPGTSQSPQGEASREAALQPRCGSGLEGALFTLVASRAGRQAPDQRRHLDGASSAFSQPASRRDPSGCGPWRLWGQGSPAKQWQTPWPLPSHLPFSANPCPVLPVLPAFSFPRRAGAVGLSLCSQGWQPDRMVWDSAMPTLSGLNPPSPCKPWALSFLRRMRILSRTEPSTPPWQPTVYSPGLDLSSPG